MTRIVRTGETEDVAFGESFTLGPFPEAGTFIKVRTIVDCACKGCIAAGSHLCNHMPDCSGAIFINDTDASRTEYALRRMGGTPEEIE